MNERPKVITTIHGAEFEVIPDRTVIVYRNGFCDAVRTFPSTYDRDQWIARDKETTRRMMATSYMYERR
jgi:uncharacterized protein (UPF0303 family)